MGDDKRCTRVLVVEDNIDLGDSQAEILTLLGYEVELARDGQSALTAVDANPPDAVLLDIGLPDMDGYEVARRMRARPVPAAQPLIVAVTGYGMPEDRHQAEEAGCDGLLVKPVGVTELEEVLKNIR